MPEMTNWMLVFVRVSAMLAIFPVFSSQNFPVQLRLALGLLMAGLIGPTLPTVAVSGGDFWTLAGLIAMEIGIGLVFGFVARMIFFAIEIGGSIIATEIGLSMPSSINPLSDAQTVAPGLMLYYMAAMIWLTLDMHHWMIAAFQRSYAFLPIGGARLSELLLTDVVERSSEIFLIALQLAAPVMAVSFIMSLVFAVLGRAVPRMNVFSESFAIRILVGMGVFGMTMQLMAQHITNYLHRLPEDVLRVAQIMGAR
jgi:flagellar biosynthetic protein FliR